MLLSHVGVLDSIFGAYKYIVNQQLLGRSTGGPGLSEGRVNVSQGGPAFCHVEARCNGGLVKNRVTPVVPFSPEPC